MLDLTNETSTEVLESLDFPIPCDHSRHHDSPFHGGHAEYVAKVTHDCPKRPGFLGTVYVCCAKWADKVTDHADKPWLCPACRVTQDGQYMVIIVGPLDLM